MYIDYDLLTGTLFRLTLDHTGRDFIAAEIARPYGIDTKNNDLGFIAISDISEV